MSEHKYRALKRICICPATDLLKKNLQNGGGWDQNPVSVHMMLASPSKWCAPVQANCTKLPTAYLPPSIPGASDWIKWPFNGKTGGGHCIAEIVNSKICKSS